MDKKESHNNPDIVSQFYHNVQFPAKYNEDDVLKKRHNFYLQEFLELKYLPVRAKILDAGCGTGFTTHVIASLRNDTNGCDARSAVEVCLLPA